MSKKKYRIYKAGGEKGRVMNPTAQFLARAEMGMQQPSPEEMAMMQQQSMPSQSQQPMEGPESQEAQMMQQMIALIAEALQNGAQPEEVVAKLLQDQVSPEIVSEALIELGMPEAEVGSIIASVMSAPSEEEMMALEQEQMKMAAEQEEGMPTEEQQAMATPTEDLTETASKGMFVKRKLKKAKEGMASNTNLAVEDNVNNVSSLIDFSKTNTLKNQYEQEYDQMMANQNMMPEARLGREARLERRAARRANRELRRDERAENREMKRAARDANRENRQAQRAYRQMYGQLSSPFGSVPGFSPYSASPYMGANLGNMTFEGTRGGLFNRLKSFKLQIDGMGFPQHFSNGMFINALHNPYVSPQGQQRIVTKVRYPGEVVDAKVIEKDIETDKKIEKEKQKEIEKKYTEDKFPREPGKEEPWWYKNYLEAEKELANTDNQSTGKNDVKGTNIGTETKGSYSKTSSNNEEAEDQAGGEEIGASYKLSAEDIEGDTLGIFEDTLTNVPGTDPKETPKEGGDDGLSIDDAIGKGIGILILTAAGWQIIKRTKKGYKKYKAKKLKNGKIKVGKPQAMSEAELEKMRKNEFFGKTKAKVQDWRNRIINKQYTSPAGKPINTPMSKYSGKFVKRPTGIRSYMKYQTNQTLGALGKPFGPYGGAQRYLRKSKLNPYSWKKPKIKLPKLGGPGGAAIMGLPILYDMATQYEDGGFVDNNLYKFTGGGDYNYFEDGGYVGYEDITDPYMPTMEYGGMPMADDGFTVTKDPNMKDLQSKEYMSSVDDRFTKNVSRSDLLSTLSPEQKQMYDAIANQDKARVQQRGRGYGYRGGYGQYPYRRGIFNTMMGIQAPAAIRRAGSWLSPYSGPAYADGTPLIGNLPDNAQLSTIEYNRRGLFERMFPGKDEEGNRIARGPRKSIKYTFNVPGSTTPSLTTKDNKISNFQINTNNRPDLNNNNQNTTYDDIDQNYIPDDGFRNEMDDGSGRLSPEQEMERDIANMANQEDQAEGTPKKRRRDMTRAERRGLTETAPGKFIDKKGRLRSADGGRRNRRNRGTEGMTETAPGKFIDSEGALVSRRGSEPTTMSMDPGFKEFGDKDFKYNPGFDPNTFKEKKSRFDAGESSKRELRKMGFKRKERQAYEEDPEIANQMRRERMRANRQYGGFQEGDEVYMTPDQVAQFMAAGGQIEFL